MKVHIYPEFAGEDDGDGGVRRVIDAQRHYLPNLGIEIVDDPAEADVIACHITVPNVYLMRFPDKPIVAHCHGLYWSEYSWENWALKANAEVMDLLRVADVITAPSEWVAQAIRRATMRPVTVINHGIEVSKEPSVVENKGFVLWNKTRPDPVCNPTVVNTLAAMLPNVQFVTTFANPAPNVTITGRLPFAEAQTLLAEAGVYLCTARETFGIGTLEAMALGVPVVGYNFGGQAEFLIHKKDAWLVAPDDVKGLTEGIERALANRSSLARAGLRTAKLFTWERAAAEYAKVYKSVLREKQLQVSVVVPAYNMEKYLADCLTSVQKQTSKDWECIVVDDASDDGTGKIADGFVEQDTRFRVIHNDENQYLAGARNTGIEQARGRYILPLDADDMLTAITLETLATALNKDRNIAIAYGGALFVEEDGKTPTDYHVANETLGHSGWPITYRHDWMMRGPGQLLPYASMYRREVWKHTCGYRTRCRSSEDQDFWLRAVSYGFRPKMVTNADTLIYRNRESSMSRAEGWRDYRPWYPWSYDIELSPAGAATEKQLPISSMDPPIISVVIPVGPGHEKYVLDAVDSVDAQTFRQWECIVINDTGGPLPLLPSWVRLQTSGGRKGVATARNIGVKASHAPLLVFLDADDYLQPFALETMLQVWQQVGGVVYSDWWDEFAPNETKHYEAPEYDAHLLTKSGAIHAVTALYPYSAWETVGGFDESLVAWEDWDFALSLADKGICGTRIPEPLWTYRKYTGMRREENYGNFEDSKAAILSKWKELWNGGRKLMGCGACPGGGGKRVRTETLTSHQRVPLNGDQNLDEVVLVEYIGTSQGARTFRGPVSETQYRFAALESEHLKYVRRVDVEVFFNRPDFRILEGVALAPTAPVNAEGKPVLVAEGPPTR